MFNRTEYNLSTFNHANHVMIFVSTLLSGLGSIYPTASDELGAKSYMPGLGTLTLTVSEKGQALLQGVGTIEAIPFREGLAVALLSGIGKIYPNASKYEVKSLTFTGSFSAGTTIVIDMDKFTFKQNGINALSTMTGDFFNLLDGETTIIYTDTSGARTIGITFDYRDRWA